MSPVGKVFSEMYGGLQVCRVCLYIRLLCATSTLTVLTYVYTLQCKEADCSMPRLALCSHSVMPNGSVKETIYI